jgi:plasmid stabilization system protein ParE
MKALRLSPRADRDLEAIAVYLATTAGIAVALDVTQALRERLSSLRSSPLMGKEGPSPTTREMVFDAYVVLYRVQPQAIDVLRIRHGKQRRPMRKA